MNDIVLINVEEKYLTLYKSSGREIISFEDIDLLKDSIGNKKVLYVTNAIESDASQITKLVEQISPQSEEAKTYYVCCTSKRSIVINDIDLRFEGIGDCKILDSNLAIAIKNSPNFQAMQKQGILAIVDKSGMRKMRRQGNKEIERKENLKRLKEEKDIDSIIMDTRSAKAANAVNSMFKEDDIFNGENDISADTPDKELSEAEIRAGRII